MRAGTLDRLITIYQIGEARDAFGGITETPSAYASNIPAHVRQIKGAEIFGNDSKIAEVDTLFRIRYDSGITKKMYITYDSADYDIYFVKEIGRNEGLEVYAKAKVD
ncbi:MAG: phage head closure protein [Pseudomonadales bacterium]|nr:phage head closure protein [Pseudomonadales bacterium]